MDTRFHPVRFSSGSAHKWVVGILLLFACADILSPQLCDEDIGAPAELARSSFVRVVRRDFPSLPSITTANPLGGSHKQPYQSTEPAPADDDCFCCCTHVLPGHFFEVTSLLVTPARADLNQTALPSAPSQAPFHPPRSA